MATLAAACTAGAGGASAQAPSTPYFQVEPTAGGRGYEGALVRIAPGMALGAVLPDLAWPPAPTRVRVLANGGDGALSDQTDTRLGVLYTTHPRDSAVADFNGDGLEDVIIVDHGSDLPPFPGGQARLLLQTTQGRFDDRTVDLPQVLAFSHSVAAGDIDGDADIDLFMGNIAGQGQVGPTVYLNDGAARFTAEYFRLPLDIAQLRDKYTASALLDLDGDGDLDLALGGHPGEGKSDGDLLLLNDGAGRFLNRSPSVLPLRARDSNWGTVHVASGDFDGDGHTDLLMSVVDGAYRRGQLQLLLWRESGYIDASARIPQAWRSPDACDQTWLKWARPADINGDGWLDIIVTGNCTVPRLFVNTGDAMFADRSDALPVLSPFTSSVLPGDLDGDGDIDLLAVNAGHGAPYVVLRNTQAIPGSKSCGYILEPSFLSTPVAGASVHARVRTGPGCPWQAGATSDWLKTMAAGRGPGAFTVSMDANPSSPRHGLVQVGQQRLGVHQAGALPTSAFHRYLAEGATSSFFDTRLALLNPGPTPTTATVRFLLGTATPVVHAVAVPAGARVTIDPKTIPGLEAAEFSTEVESDQPLVVDRTMTWDGAGYGAHSETAVSSPASTWYFAEGATIDGFQLFYLLQNPSTQDVPVRIRYLRTVGPPLEKTYILPARSRQNIWANVENFPGLGRALASAEFSAIVEATDATPIIVERAMYRSSRGRTFDAGHESAGVTAPATQRFLAEGATGSYFDLFVLIANPTTTDAQVKLTYLLAGGKVLTRTMKAPANVRSGVWVDMEQFDGTVGYPLANVAVSTTVESLNSVPLVVERAMWWPGDAGTWHEAHNSAGATATGTKWAVAEGEVGGPRGVETYLLISNTSDFSGSAKVTLHFEDGGVAERTYALDPRSRTNVNVAADFGSQTTGRRFGAVVQSFGTTPAQIVVERAMYGNADGVTWAAGTNALATKVQ